MTLIKETSLYLHSSSSAVYLAVGAEEASLIITNYTVVGGEGRITGTANQHL